MALGNFPELCSRLKPVHDLGLPKVHSQPLPLQDVNILSPHLVGQTKDF